MTERVTATGYITGRGISKGMAFFDDMQGVMVVISRGIQYHEDASPMYRVAPHPEPPAEYAAAATLGRIAAEVASSEEAEPPHGPRVAEWRPRRYHSLADLGGLYIYEPGVLLWEPPSWDDMATIHWLVSEPLAAQARAAILVPQRYGPLPEYHVTPLDPH